MHYLFGELVMFDDAETSSAKTAVLYANTAVLEIKLYETRTVTVAVTAFCNLEHGDDENTVYLETVEISRSGVGERASDRAKITIGGKMVVEKFETIVGVRLATQDEMNALSAQYYEKPRGLQHGDVYLPEGEQQWLLTKKEAASNAKELQKKKSVDKNKLVSVVPRDDPFDYFSRLSDKFGTLDNPSTYEDFVQARDHLASDYLRYTTELFERQGEARNAREGTGAHRRARRGGEAHRALLPPRPRLRLANG
eukprot:1932896-Prymnesium_polylepis.5